MTQQFHSPIQLSLRDGIGPGQDDGGGSLDLVVIELTEVLHINLDLSGIRNGHPIAKTDVFAGDLFHRCNHIRQLAYTRGLNDNPVRMVLFNHFVQSLAEIAHQRAADTAGIHFRNVDTGLLQETAVNADLTKFILDEHQLLTAVGFLDHLFDEGGFTRTQKTGINVDNCHFHSPSV